METRGIKFVTKMANKKASQKRKDGEVPKHMNLDGQLALMHDKIIRYFKTRNLDDILGLAADGLFALEAAFSELTDEEDTNYDVESEDVDQYIELEDCVHIPDNITEDEDDDISSLLPDEFKKWESNTAIADKLKKYIEDSDQWGNLPQKIQVRIIAAQGEDEEE